MFPSQNDIIYASTGPPNLRNPCRCWSQNETGHYMTYKFERSLNVYRPLFWLEMFFISSGLVLTTYKRLLIQQTVRLRYYLTQIFDILKVESLILMW